VTARNAAARPVLKWARSLGCDATFSGGHWRITYQGHRVCTVSGTPSCSRSMKNAKAQIRRRLRAIQATRSTN
jgi:hypothetical protein